MDWDNLVADQTAILSTHFTSGRQGRSIDKVIVHHNGGNLSVRGCYSVWQTRPASAHYQVCSDGTIGQLVWDRDTAWHASDWGANLTSIGIEHADCQSDPWRISDACLDAGAHLVAAVCRFYGLGRPEWGVNLFGHSDFAPTECPASLAEGGSQHDEYVARAQWWYDVMTGAAAPEEEDMTDEQAGMLKAIYDVLVPYMGWQYENTDGSDDGVDMHKMLKDVWKTLVPYMGFQYRATGADGGPGGDDPVDMHGMIRATYDALPKLLALCDRMDAVEARLGIAKADAAPEAGKAEKAE